MSQHLPADELARLHDTVMPALSRAAVGDFSGEVELDPDASRQSNEIAMGVGMLLEVIREKDEELANRAPKIPGTDSSVGLLDEVLHRPAE